MLHVCSLSFPQPLSFRDCSQSTFPFHHHRVVWRIASKCINTPCLLLLLDLDADVTTKNPFCTEAMPTFLSSFFNSGERNHSQETLQYDRRLRTEDPRIIEGKRHFYRRPSCIKSAAGFLPSLSHYGLMITSVLQLVNRLMQVGCQYCKYQVASSLIFTDLVQLHDKLASN